MCLNLAFFMFILHGVYSASWICGFIVSVEFRKLWLLFLQNLLSLPLFFLELHWYRGYTTGYYPTGHQGIFMLFFLVFFFLISVLIWISVPSNSLSFSSIVFTSSLLWIPSSVLFTSDIIKISSLEVPFVTFLYLLSHSLSWLWCIPLPSWTHGTYFNSYFNILLCEFYHFCHLWVAFFWFLFPPDYWT